MAKESMNSSAKNSLNRRQFLQTASTAAALGMTVEGATQEVSIVIDPTDPIAGRVAARWAANELERSLSAAGVSVQRCERTAGAKPGNQIIVAAGPSSTEAREILKVAGVASPNTPEAIALVPGKTSGRPVLLACGYDSRALVYALLDLADRVQNSSTLGIQKPIVERPANTIRSAMRLVTSDVEDKPWFDDRAMWPQYLTMLATNRFNRFSLALGMVYDFIRQVTDAYFLFA